MTPFDTDRSYRRGGGGVRLVAAAAASVFQEIFKAMLIGRFILLNGNNTSRFRLTKK